MRSYEDDIYHFYRQIILSVLGFVSQWIPGWNTDDLGLDLLV